MKEQITYETFDMIDIRLGTVISVKKNEKARKPSLVIKVDFGEKIGIKQSSAQITHFYNEENFELCDKWICFGLTLDFKGGKGAGTLLGVLIVALPGSVLYIVFTL